MTTTSPGSIALRLDGGEALLLGVEHARRAAVVQALVAGELHDAAVRREVAAQDRQAAGRLERALDRDDDLLPRRLDDRGRDLAERAAVDGRRVAVHEPRLQQLARDERDAAGGVQVGGDEAAARLDVGDDRRALGDRGRSRRARASMPSSRAIASRWRTPFVEPPVAATAAIAFSSASRVMICDGPHVVADEPHRDPAGLVAPPPSSPGRSPARRSARPALMPRNSSTVAIVFAVNWPPHAPAPGQATPSSSCTSSSAHRAGGRARRPPRRRPGW